MAHQQSYQQYQQYQQQQSPLPPPVSNFQHQQQQGGQQQQQTQSSPFQQPQTGFRPGPGAGPAGLTGMRAMSPPVTSPVGQSPSIPHRVASPSVQATPPGTQSPTLSNASSAPQSPTHPAGLHQHRARQKRMYPEQITSAYTAPVYPSASPIPQQYPHQQVQQQPQQQPQQQQQQQPQLHQQQQPLVNQFGQMNLQNNTTQSIPLIGAGPAIEDLQQPPPAIQLPPNTSITSSPFANADPSYQCCTLSAVPATDSLLKKSKLPLALVLSPYRTADKGKQDDVIVIRDNVIARCRRCRTYINPFVTFVEGGQRWKCNMCFLLNDVPAAFDYDPQTQQPADRWQRPELNYSCVEYVAPTEYMVRPPQAPAYVFVLDVSFSAIQSGMLAVAARTMLDSLDRIPNQDGRTRVAFIAVDSALHFFTLDPSRAEPSMLVVSDLDDIYLPDPANLLAPLATCQDAVKSLLTKLPSMFKDTVNQHNALGTALEAAFKIVSPYGGKIVCLQSTLPDMGTGALKPREDTKLYGTSKESQLLNPSSPFFKSFPVECSRSQVACDMLVFGGQYADLATLSCLPHYTGGQTYYYPGFTADKAEDVAKLTHEFGELLAEEIGLEAVLRVRASRNLRMSAFHGNFFIRSSDLLALPNVPRNQSYCIEVEIEDDLRGPTACFQSALLHTNCYGERRIRVITLCLPVTQSIAECCTGMNPYAITAYLANKGVERGISAKLEDARDAILHKCGEILGTYKTHVLGMGKGASTNQLTVPANLKLLPLLVLALIKHDALRQTTTPVSSDTRVNAMNLLRTMPIQLLIPYLVPNLYALHALAPPGPNALFPPSLNLTQASLEAHGCYLLEDGQTLSIWVGRGVVPQLCVDLFGVKGYTEIQNGKTTLPVLDTAISKRTHGLIHTLRAVRRGNYYPVVHIVKEDSDPLTRSRFLGRLLEDRTDTMHSYQQFLQFMKDKVNYVTS